MLCPIDGSELKISDRQGVEIDYCPQCRGVWLDRGELDKLIERSASQFSVYASRPTEVRESTDRRYDDDDYDPYKKKKRKSFLDDIFDF